MIDFGTAEKEKIDTHPIIFQRRSYLWMAPGMSVNDGIIEELPNSQKRRRVGCSGMVKGPSCQINGVQFIGTL